MARAIFVFSADPVTKGHLDVVRRAAKMFDQLIVGVGNNPDKKYLFSFSERLAMVKNVLKSFENVSVKACHGLTVDFALQNKAGVIVRGVRTSADLDFELSYAQMNLSQKTDLQTVFVPADPGMIHVSSSIVKGIQKDHGLITDFVPYSVKQKLEAKISKQYFISITGAISAGKSTFSNELVHYMRQNYEIETHNIEMDKIGHKILSEGNDSYYVEVRKEIADTFGQDLIDEEGFIKRTELGKIVFKDDEKLAQLESMIYNPIRIELNKQTRYLEGLIFITAALIVEKELLFRSNNHVVLVHASDSIRKARLLKNGFSEEEAQARMDSQMKYKNKVNAIEKSIEEEGFGALYEVNTDDGYEECVLEKTAEHISSVFNFSKGLNY